MLAKGKKSIFIFAVRNILVNIAKMGGKKTKREKPRTTDHTEEPVAKSQQTRPKRRRARAPPADKSIPHHTDLLHHAFNEWLIQRVSLERHTLWAEFHEKLSPFIPEYDLPPSTHRSFNLHAYAKSLRHPNHIHSIRQGVKKCREAMLQCGMKTNQTLIQWYLSDEINYEDYESVDDEKTDSKRQRKNETEEYEGPLSISVSNQFDCLSDIR